MTSKDDPTKTFVVFVAEDTEIFAHLLGDALRAHLPVACAVEVCRSGEALLDRAEKELVRPASRRIGLLVVDVQMPGIGGLEAAKRFRLLEAKHKISHAPILFFSGYAESPAVTATVAACFPARFVQKDKGGHARAAVVGAKLFRDVLLQSGVVKDSKDV